MIVEIRDSEFEFYHFNKPTGHYARGFVESEDGLNYKVKLLCNGKQYIVDKIICREI